MQKVRYQHHNSICESMSSLIIRLVRAYDQWDPAEVLVDLLRELVCIRLADRI